MSLKPGITILVLCLCLHGNSVLGQACNNLGQTPATAFPVCGTTAFIQDNVPLCINQEVMPVPGCLPGYPDRNPFYYKFTCFVSGTLAFVITPKNLADDYDWQLYDITGLNPSQIFTNQNIVVTGNWAGNPGATGTSANGVDFIQCASTYDGTESRFAKMPNLIAGHEYILLVSHFTDSQSGYSLTFNGGTAVITDPKEPHLEKATPNCDGKMITLKLNKKMKCSSLTGTGTEFSLLPAAATIVSAVATNCNSSFDFDEVTITLANALPAGNYQLAVRLGTDNNTVLDNCERGVPSGEQTQFTYVAPQPIPIDSVGRVGCAPDEIKLHFSKKIDCSTIDNNGSNFRITGPTPVTVIAATGDNCVAGLSDIITVRFSSPVYTKGLYTVIPKLSVNGGAVMDECGMVIQPQPVSFNTVDTVSARFTFTNDIGCRFDTMTFSHNGAHDVNKWEWIFNSTQNYTTPAHTIIFPATSTNTVQLTVTNGVCSAIATETIVLDNEVKAGFEMPDVLCPEDRLILTNTSSGLIDTWRWNYTIGTSQAETPQPILFPTNNIESFYTIKLVTTNNTLGCSDSLSKQLKVLDNCFIAVPSAFTPNGDGLNDFLYPNNALKATNLEFKVFNRWGQVVFESRNWQEKWDGKIGGIPQTTGVYVWFLRYTHSATGKKVFQKGTTTLIR